MPYPYNDIYSLAGMPPLNHRPRATLPGEVSSPAYDGEASASVNAHGGTFVNGAYGTADAIIGGRTDGTVVEQLKEQDGRR